MTRMPLALLIVAAIARPGLAEPPAAEAPSAAKEAVAVSFLFWTVSFETPRKAPAANPWKPGTGAPPLEGDLALPPIIPPVPLSLETQLGQLEILRTQKAVIEQQEAALRKAIEENAARQFERMKKLGIDVPKAKDSPVPPKGKP